MTLRRLLVCLALLAATAVGLEWTCGRQLARVREAGGVVPPFGRTTEPAQRLARFRSTLAALEQAPPPPVKGRFDARYGWINAPGSYWEGPAQLHINSIGARGALEFADAPVAGVRRVLCFGDSFTYGTEVADGEDWPFLIGDGDPALEVINLGVGGWSLDQALIRWREDGAGLDADGVLCGLSLGSIGRHVNRYRPLLYPSDPNPVVKPRFRLRGDELVLVPQPYASRLELYRAAAAGTLLAEMSPGDHWAGDAPALPWSNLSTLLATRRAQARRSVPDQWSDTEGEPFRVTLALIEALQRETRAAGVEVTAVVIFPRKADWKYHLKDGWEERVFWRTLRTALDQRGLSYVDLFPVLRSGEVEQLYRRVHLSPEGNRRVAEHVGRWLRGQWG